MNVAIYARVSTADQSLDPQWIELRAWVAARKWKIVGEFSDVMSGAKGERPGLQSLLEHCAAGRVQVVACVKLDRLGRSTLNVVSLVQRLKSMGTSVAFASQGLDNLDDSPCGKVVMGVMALFAEFERDLIRDRTKAGLRAAVARGSKLGRKPMPRDDAADEAAVEAWEAKGRPGGLRGLAKELGVASPMTAGRIVAKVMDA